MRLKFILALTIVCLANVARANDGAIEGVGGSLQPLQGEHPQVRMVRERVKLDIYGDYYDVVALFIFKNEGEATVTGMGFPESSGGDVNDHTYVTAFSGFRTTVDGRRVITRRQPLKGGDEDYKALWVKKVPFKKGQARTVEVRYRARSGESIVTGGHDRGAEYDFTGGNWHGKVERSDLICNLHVPGTVIACTEFGNEALPMRRVGRTYTFTWRNWEAQGNFSFNWVRSLPGWMLLNHDSTSMPYWGKSGVFLDDRHPPQVTSFSCEQVDVRPAAFIAKGVGYIGLADLSEFLQQQSQAANRMDSVQVGWHSDGTALLKLPGRTLTFPAGKAYFLDSRQVAPVKLPAPGLVTVGKSYIPVAAVAQALGGRVTLAQPEGGRVRRLELLIPPFWKSTNP